MSHIKLRWSCLIAVALNNAEYRAAISGRTARRSMKWLTKDKSPARRLIRGQRKNSTVLVVTVVER
ncbi:hypothetical protein ACVWZM_006751 [Bradyrhizobium sp. USDA 4501]